MSRIALSQHGTIAVATVTGHLLIWMSHPFNLKPDHYTRVVGHAVPHVAMRSPHASGSAPLCFVLWLEDSRVHKSVGADGSRELMSEYVMTFGTDMASVIFEVNAGGIFERCRIQHQSVPTCAVRHPSRRQCLLVSYLSGLVLGWNYFINAKDVKMVPLRDDKLAISINKPLTCLSVSPDGRKLAAGTSKGQVRVYDMRSLILDMEVDCRNASGSMHSGRKVSCLHWTVDSQNICVTCADDRVRIVHLSDLSKRTKFKHVFFTNENMFNQAVVIGQRIVAVSEQGYVLEWGVHSGTQTNTVAGSFRLCRIKGKGEPGHATQQSRSAAVSVASEQSPRPESVTPLSRGPAPERIDEHQEIKTEERDKPRHESVMLSFVNRIACFGGQRDPTTLSPLRGAAVQRLQSTQQGTGEGSLLGSAVTASAIVDHTHGFANTLLRLWSAESTRPPTLSCVVVCASSGGTIGILSQNLF